MREENRIVNSLWIGEKLENLELLTIKSFLAHGHEFNLWTYGEIKTQLPERTTIRNASEIIPPDQIFRYKYTNQYGHGKGSVAGFADIFRLKLLFEKGGWWVDMDVTCLRPLNFETPYFFRKDAARSVVNNLIKCPPGSPMMKHCYEETAAKIDENNRVWMLPSQILKASIEKFQLEKFVNASVSNADRGEQIEIYLNSNPHIPNKQHIIHWGNEEWRVKKIDKSVSIESSIHHKLLMKYELDYRLEKRKTSRFRLGYFEVKLLVLKFLNR